MGRAAFQHLMLGSSWGRRCDWKSSREHDEIGRDEYIEVLVK